MEQPNSLLSTDALPMTPRPLEETEAISDSAEQSPQRSNDEEAVPELSGTEDFEEIPAPHPDWKFNIFLDQIAEGITGEEFDQLKHLYRGHGGISEDTLKEMKSVRDLFTIMRTRRLLGRENLVYLHSMLYRLGRVDLIKDGIEYANTVGNVIHFYPASSFPENGYKYVKFHVEGRNFRNCTREYVRRLRSLISEVLFIPAEFVIIAGVEPSSSLLITLMIQEPSVIMLERLLEDHTYAKEMKELGIDFIEIDKVYSVGDDISTEISDNDQQKKFASLYKQLEMKTKQLEESETERLRIARQHSDYQSKIRELEAKHCQDEIVIMTLKASEATDSTEPVESVTQKAIEEFESVLKTVRLHDKTDIHKLLSTNVSVVASRLNEKFRIRQRQFELALEDLISQILPLQFEIQKLQFFAEIDVKDMDKMLLESFKKLMQSFETEVSVSTIEVEVNEEVLQILKKISIALQPKERESLIKKYTLDSDEQLKHTIDTDQSSLLACLLLKEISQTQKQIDVETFISQCLVEVGRKDLAKKVHEKFTQADENPKKKQHTSQGERSGSRTSKGDKRGKPADQTDQILIKVAEQVQEIYDTIRMNKDEFSQGLGFSKGFGLSYDPPPYSRYPFCQHNSTDKH